ncbi:MAG: PilZ domain-containing protein [Candidatus Omnitrophica bacterium]|nr:PilZ domain-containing protein [Candidatus Omnitrophota bacterium]
MDTGNFQDEKRQYKRVTLPGVSCSFKLLDPRTWSTYHDKTVNDVQDISIGGLRLCTKNELILKAPIGIDIKINSSQELIRTFGRVAWIRKKNPTSDDYNVGISFSWWKNDEEKKIVYDAIASQIS